MIHYLRIAALAVLAVFVAAPALSFAQSAAGQYVRDEGLVMRVTSKLQFNRQLLREKIEVKANQGIVSLSGYVSSPELRALAARLAAETGGVKLVHNGLIVGAAPPVESVPAQ